MKPKTELMAFRLPADLAASIRAQAVGDVTITDVVIRMLRSAPEFHDGDHRQLITRGDGQIVETPLHPSQRGSYNEVVRDAAPTARPPVRKQPRGIRPKGDTKR